MFWQLPTAQALESLYAYTVVRSNGLVHLSDDVLYNTSKTCVDGAKYLASFIHVDVLGYAGAVAPKTWVWWGSTMSTAVGARCDLLKKFS